MKMNESRLSDKEKQCLKKTVELWASIIDMPIIHSDDVNDFRFHIHAIQHMIFARPEIINQKGIEVVSDDFRFDLDEPILKHGY